MVRFPQPRGNVHADLCPITPKQRSLAAGQLALGFGVHHLRGSAVGIIAAATGYDWLFIDMEHGATSVQEATQIAIAALNQGITPIVRCCKDALFEGPGRSTTAPWA